MKLFLLIAVISVTQIDYSKFSHSTKQHQAECKTCHTVPTKDWTEASKFPDVVDYPDHDACVSCHRRQFFRGARPQICSVCHEKTGPREEARYAFRNPASRLQFTIEFPHDKHQDVIARLFRPTRARRTRARSAPTAELQQLHDLSRPCNYNIQSFTNGSRIVFQLSLEIATTRRYRLQGLSQIVRAVQRCCWTNTDFRKVHTRRRGRESEPRSRVHRVSHQHHQIGNTTRSETRCSDHGLYRVSQQRRTATGCQQRTGSD